MAREHEAGKKSILEILETAKLERANTMKRMNEMKTKHLLQKDREALENIVENAEKEFMTSWDDRKQSLTRHAKFCLFASSLKNLSTDMFEFVEMLKIKTQVEESLASTMASSAYLSAADTKMAELGDRVVAIRHEGEILCQDLPEHKTTMDMGLKQVSDKWSSLLQLVQVRRQIMSAARDYFALLEKAETFLKDANRTLLDWSRKFPKLTASTEDGEIENLKRDIDAYVKTHKANQQETIVKMTARRWTGIWNKVF